MEIPVVGLLLAVLLPLLIRVLRLLETVLCLVADRCRQLGRPHRQRSTATFRSGRSSRSGQSSAAAGGRYGVTRKSFGRKVKAGDLFPAGLDKAFGQFQRYGALSTNETGISSTLGVTDACFLGHASFRYEQLMTMFWQALIKSLFAECNINIYN